MSARTASRRLPTAIVSLFLVLSAGIAVTGYMYYREQGAEFSEHVGNELAAIADMKARSVADWRRERIGDAEDICRRHESEIHLLVSDVVMPVLSGPQLAQRQRVLCPAMRVLYVSGYAESVIANQGALEAGGTVVESAVYAPA